MTETTDATPTATKTKKNANVDATIEENEIRVTAQGKMRNYVAYAATIFSESKSHTVVLKGMGRVINKTVSLAEILKRRVKGLYQLAEIGSIKVVDKKSGKGDEEPTEVVRLLSVIKIVLTTEPEDKAKYQPPIDESMVEPMTTSLPKRARPNRSRNKAKKSDAKDVPEASERDDTKAAKAKRLKRKRNRRAKKEAAKEAEETTATPNEAKKPEEETEKKVVAVAAVAAEEAAPKPSTEASA